MECRSPSSGHQCGSVACRCCSRCSTAKRGSHAEDEKVTRPHRTEQLCLPRYNTTARPQDQDQHLTVHVAWLTKHDLHLYVEHVQGPTRTIGVYHADATARNHRRGSDLSFILKQLAALCFRTDASIEPALMPTSAAPWKPLVYMSTCIATVTCGSQRPARRRQESLTANQERILSL